MRQRILVAVSGGIDSVVLLDRLAHRKDIELFVAHFDHGTRPDSAADARFVRALAQRYGIPFVMRREELGSGVSEEYARKRRYAFLRAEAAKRKALIATGHHNNDVIETIAINIVRGTGWRGLAVLFGTRGVIRPQLKMTKKELRQYALDHRLEWVEDSTNAQDYYLRNRIRRKISRISMGDRRKIIFLWLSQLRLKKEIDTMVQQQLPTHSPYGRYLFIMADPLECNELLRAAVLREVNVSLTRPQVRRAVIAIKTAHPGAIAEVGSGVRLRFSLRNFIVETL